MTDQQAQLFSNNVAAAPLAARMRPRTLEEFSGQRHLLAANSPLRLAIESGAPPSLVFWGPPGSGKTTLAKIIASSSNMPFATLSAVTDGVKDIRQVVAQAQVAQAGGRRSLLFIDEVHRFNKAQQDALLPFVEQGLFTLVGATTENPSFELNNALLSRVQVFRLELLEPPALVEILQRALGDSERGLGRSGLQVAAEQLEIIAQVAAGDARAALAYLELLAQVALSRGEQHIGGELLQQVLEQRRVAFDKGGDHFYEQISALHKAVRGSAPDAALYWLARMLCGGCDPLYIARRLLRMAAEDIGLADPRALRVALDGYDMQQRLGSPEGELGLAQATLYLAVAPKSNAVYRAFGAATEMAREHGTEPVPLHLRNAPTGLMQQQGYGAGYRYAHDYPGAYAAGEVYMPPALAGAQLYQPGEQGLEAAIRQRLAQWHALDANSDFHRYD
ncbi:MAG: replication-associated recombination protein A [Pseudomonadales bacterium]|nr:replication-associated recombination protein A [Pseudomonadales bacterium]